MVNRKSHDGACDCIYSVECLHNCAIFEDFTHTKTYISYFHHNIRTGPSFLKIRNEGPQGKPKYAKVKPTWAPQWGADFSAQSVLPKPPKTKVRQSKTNVGANTNYSIVCVVRFLTHNQATTARMSSSDGSCK